MDTLADEPKCCICFEICDSLFLMPCCGTEESSVRYCGECIKKVCAADKASKDTVGVCPICKKSFEMEITVTGLKKFELRGRCSMCCQGNKIIVSFADSLCENCLLGKAHPYKYTCNRCGKTQVIPHPMWKYQKRPDEFGSASWACHQQCNDYTHWKIVPEDICKIPAGLLPDTWRPTSSDAESSLAATRDMIKRS